MAEALNNQCVPTLSGRGLWTVHLVDNAVRRSHRERIQTASEARTEQIKEAIEQLTQGQVYALGDRKKIEPKRCPHVLGKGEMEWHFSRILFERSKPCYH